MLLTWKNRMLAATLFLHIIKLDRGGIMKNKSKSEWIHLIVIIGCILFFIEFIFIETGLLFIVITASIAIYYGRKRYYKTTGKVLFWGGAFFLFITILNTFAVRFLLLVIVIYLFWKWYKRRQEQQGPIYIPTTKEANRENGKLYGNKWFGSMHQGAHAYVWEDINVQSIVSDITIDLNNTVLPDEATIIIRQIVGKVTIIVPYEIEVIIDHSVLYGDTVVFDQELQYGFNRNVQMKSEGYDISIQRVRIYTQVWIGKLEVKRG